jgi:hypothetical protein
MTSASTINCAGRNPERAFIGVLLGEFLGRVVVYRSVSGQLGTSGRGVACGDKSQDKTSDSNQPEVDDATHDDEACQDPQPLRDADPDRMVVSTIVGHGCHQPARERRGRWTLDQDERGENARCRSISDLMANRSQEIRRDGNNPGKSIK